MAEHLTPTGVNLILKKHQEEAKLEIKPSLSGQSFRVGRVLDLLNEGESSYLKLCFAADWEPNQQLFVI